jgi:hypothetical protein
MIPRSASAFLLLLAFALGALLPRAAHATPGKDGCAMIPFDPAQPTIGIHGPHTWCLDRDIVVTQDESVIKLVTVHGSDTTIDCRGHLLECQGTANFSYGIATADGAERVTVRNCRFRGFSTSISLGSGKGNVVEDNLIHSSRAGTFGLSTAIEAYDNAVIRRNRVFDSIGRAIATGSGAVIADNLVDGVSDSSFDNYIVAIELLGDGVEITGNTLRGLRHASPDDTSPVQAIQLSGEDTGQRTNIADNVLVNTDAFESIALACLGDSARFTDNVITGFTYPAVNCGEPGDNDVSP